VTVLFGPPLRPADGEDARRFGARIESAVGILADEARSDWWQARRRAADGTSPSPQGPDASPWRRAWALDPAPDRDPAPTDPVRTAAANGGERRWPPV